MANNVACHVCGENLKISGKHRDSAVGYHLINKHPKIIIGHFLCEDNLGGGKCTLKEKINKVSLKGKCFVPEKNRKNRKVHKTVVERWRNGGEVKQCPKCATSDKPLVRIQKNKIALYPLGACFLLCCWPIFFLPLMMRGKTSFLVCCRKCGYCFGAYNPKSGQLSRLNEEKTLDLSDIRPK